MKKVYRILSMQSTKLLKNFRWRSALTEEEAHIRWSILPRAKRRVSLPEQHPLPFHGDSSSAY